MKGLLRFFKNIFIRHVWEEHKRSVVKVYETWDYNDPRPELPAYRKVTIELKCKLCGAIKIVQYRE